jgi:PAT family beta-lactamase induction signal transducer AmpG
MAAETPARRSWGQSLAIYIERPVLSMFFLGFSAGLPFYLVFSTLSAWLRTEHIDRATIGMLAWVGLMLLVQMDVGTNCRSRRAAATR